MKTSLRIRILAMSLFALAAFGFASNSFAFTFQKIEITNSDGKITVVTVDENGNFTSPPMKAGTYTYSWALSSKPAGSRAQLNSSDGSSVTASFDREASIPSVSEVVVSYAIQSPRDLASGQASGKRMHKPFVITKELNRSTPLLSTSLGTVVVDTDGVAITGTVSFKTKPPSPAKPSVPGPIDAPTPPVR